MKDEVAYICEKISLMELTLWLKRVFHYNKDEVKKRKLLSFRLSESIPLEQGLRQFRENGHVANIPRQRVFH